MRISNNLSPAHKLSQLAKFPNDSNDYENKLDTIQDIVDIKTRPVGSQFEAWIDFALENPAQSVLALNSSQDDLPLSRGQRFALRRLQQRSHSASSDSERNVTLQGGLTALKHLGGSEADGPTISRAVQSLLIGANDISPQSRERFLEAGIDTIYDRSLADGSTALKLQLPNQGLIGDSVFMADLLKLDPNFQKLPSLLAQQMVSQPTELSLSETDREQIKALLAKNQVEMPQRVSTMGTPLNEVQAALVREREFALNNLDATMADTAGLVNSLLDNFDSKNLSDVFRASTNTTELISSKFQAESRRLKSKNLLKMGLFAGVGVAAGLAFLSVPLAPVGFSMEASVALSMGVAAAGLLGSFASLFGLSSSLRNYHQEPSELQSQSAQLGKQVQSHEKYIVNVLESTKDPLSGRGLAVSKETLCQRAAESLVKQTTFKDIDVATKRLRKLESLPGKNAAEVFRVAYEEQDKDLLEFISREFTPIQEKSSSY